MTCSSVSGISRMPRVRASERRSLRSPARSARPRPRRRCCGCSARKGRPTPPRRRSTITRAGRCRWRAARRGALCDLRDRHESRGRNRPLSKMVRPQIAIITTVEPVHLEFSPARRNRRCQGRNFRGLDTGGRWCSTATIRNSPGWSNARGTRCFAHRNFGTDNIGRAAARHRRCGPACSAVHANILGHDVTYKLGCPGAT